MQYVECKNIYVILFTNSYLCNILTLTTNKKPPHPARLNGGTNQKKGGYIVTQVKIYDKNRIITEFKRKNRQKRMG